MIRPCVFSRLVLLGWLAIAPALLYAQEVVVTGVVSDKRTESRIADAFVTITSTSGVLIDTVRTDVNGNWSFTFLSDGVVRPGLLPESAILGHNFPNPFNPTTRIPFRVPKKSTVRLSVHNILGQLMDAREFELGPGMYSIEWQGTGSAGVYIYSIDLGGRRYAGKMVQMEGGGIQGFGRLVPYSGPIAPVVRNSQAVSICATVNAFAYEPDSAVVALSGSPRVETMLESIHDRAFVVDLHNDVVEKIVAAQYTYDIGVRHTTNHTDLPRMRDGGLDAQLFSIYVDPSAYDPSQYFLRAAQFIDSLSAQVSRNTSQMGLAMTEDSIRRLNTDGKIAGILMVEGGHCIQDDLEKLKYFYAKGVRCMTITWNNSTSWAVSAQDSRSATVGLSDFGKQVIRTMDSLGMLIDVSHVGKKTVEDILAIATGPVIASHSGCAALYSHYRNLSDDQIRGIAATGGVIGVVFYPPFLSRFANVTIETVVDHMDYIKNLVGIDYVALGSDFDGIERTPAGLEDVSRFPELTKVLLRRGYSKEEVRKVLGGNFLRVLQSVCK